MWKFVVILAGFVVSSQAFWWPLSNSNAIDRVDEDVSEPQQPALKQVPVAYFRTYSYQPFLAIPQLPMMPLHNLPKYMSPMMKMLNPQQSMTSGTFPMSQGLLGAPSLLHATSDTIRPILSSTTSTTTPAPTTTSTTTTTTTTTTPKPIPTTSTAPTVTTVASLHTYYPDLQPPRAPPMYFNPPTHLNTLPFSNTRSGFISPMAYQQSFNDPLMQQFLSNYLSTNNVPMHQAQYVPCMCQYSPFGVNIPTIPPLTTLPGSPISSVSYPTSPYPSTQYPSTQYPSPTYPTQSFYPSSSSISSSSSTASSMYPTLPEIIANKRSDDYGILPISGDDEQLIDFDAHPTPTDAQFI